MTDIYEAYNEIKRTPEDSYFDEIEENDDYAEDFDFWNIDLEAKEALGNDN